MIDLAVLVIAVHPAAVIQIDPKGLLDQVREITHDPDADLFGAFRQRRHGFMVMVEDVVLLARALHCRIQLRRHVSVAP